MQIYYSPFKDSCYPEELMESYKDAGNLPEDIVLISYQDFLCYFLEISPTGKQRTFSNGTFSWKDLSISFESQIQTERAWVAEELERATIELEKVQDSDPTSIGTVTQWRNYRKELRAWEFSSHFPEKTFRPSSPII